MDKKILKAVESVLFHWFECEHGQCGYLDLAMKNLRDCPAGKPFRDYIARLDADIKK